ncbi:unnamed protein product [Protopolystoma xenopodis]|uniref:Uncharacterized protein n=1 Tax=Protopolystoma xenopodis TaxID=117903 RepID=A0A448XRE8_9PLAT|nr:unnamed protein product [Protopolystoma xenopodis]
MAVEDWRPGFAEGQRRRPLCLQTGTSSGSAGRTSFCPLTEAQTHVYTSPALHFRFAFIRHVGHVYLLGRPDAMSSRRSQSKPIVDRFIRPPIAGRRVYSTPAWDLGPPTSAGSGYKIGPVLSVQPCLDGWSFCHSQC